MHEASSGSWRVMCWSEYTGAFVGASNKGQVLVAFWEACIPSSISLQKSGQFCHQVCAHATLVPFCSMFSLYVSSLSIKQCLKLLWTAFKPQRRRLRGMMWCSVLLVSFIPSWWKHRFRCSYCTYYIQTAWVSLCGGWAPRQRSLGLKSTQALQQVR